MIKVRHIGITVNDLTRMLEFYQLLLGFSQAAVNLESGLQIDNFSDLEGVQVTTAKLSNGTDEVLIELLKYHSHDSRQLNRSGINDEGISHFALTVDDLEGLYSYLLASNIEFNSPPQTMPGGKAKVTFCKDPEGNLIELVEAL